MAEDIKKDPIRIARDEHDPVSKAKKVKITDTQINMELDHLDGDSVTSHPAKLSASVIGVEVSDNGTEIIPPLDCSSMRLIAARIDGSGTINVQVSLSDSGDHWVNFSGENPGSIVVARRVRVMSIDVVGDVHLVGRS
jgi:hypothetical protein